MGRLRTSGLTSVILVLLLMVGLLTAASVVNEGTESTTTEEDYEQMVQEIIDDISTMIDVKDQKCRFYETDGCLKIERIALLISPKVSQEIDFNQLTIQLDNGEFVQFLTYGNNSQSLDGSTLFEHIIWEQINESNFGFISVTDLDNSLVDFDCFNENSDNAYLIFKLSEPMKMKKHQKITVTLFPSTGLVTKLYLQAPLPTTLVKTFE
jgi:archaellin